MIEQPKQLKILIPIKLSKSPSFWIKNLAEVGFSSVTQTEQNLELKFILAEDSSGKEHEAIKIKISKNEFILEVLAEQKNLYKRKLEALRLAILVLSLIEPEQKNSKLFSEIAKGLEEAISLIDAKAALLLIENSKLKEENSNLLKKLENSNNEKELLTKKLMQNSIKISELNSKLQRLLEVPDSIIQDELLEWLKIHEGQINISDFCVRYSYPPSRVIENLDKLAKMGKISRVE
ncbi:MAG: hypothetical protein NC918_00695 [Candidatus Omnitrophica bacterium]|nr:hypothetical protein [Candidatus Omnitrophota bacterium]